MPRAQVLTHDPRGVRVAGYSLMAPSRADKRPPAKPGDVLDVTDAELARGVGLGLLVELDADGNPVGSSGTTSPEAEQPAKGDTTRDGAGVARSVHAREVAGSNPAPATDETAGLPPAKAPKGPMPDEPAASATPVETVEVAADKPVTPAEATEVHAPTAGPGDDSTPEATESAPTPAPKRRTSGRRGGKRGG
jgi:hypothetical protein